MSTTPPGWYPDPYGKATHRWWSGAEWTDHTAGGESTATTAGGAGRPPGWSMVALVAAATLAVGAVAGYVVRGDGGGSTDGGGSSIDVGAGGSGSGRRVVAEPLIAGFASLDTFEFELVAITAGPGPSDRSQTTIIGRNDNQADAVHTKTTTTTTSAEDGTETDETESWRVGDASCEYDDWDEEWVVEARNPLELDLLGVLPGVFDIVLIADNAELVGTETVAGVPTRHHRFTISGLGVGSGAQVTANEGAIWVAEDGGYVVRYQVRVGTRTGPDGSPESEINDLDLRIELTSINQPLAISLPPGCTG